MPELPDVAVYVEALVSRVLGHRLERVKIANPFLLRSFDPPPQALEAILPRRREPKEKPAPPPREDAAPVLSLLPERR